MYIACIKYFKIGAFPDGSVQKKCLEYSNLDCTSVRGQNCFEKDSIPVTHHTERMGLTIGSVARGD